MGNPTQSTPTGAVGVNIETIKSKVANTNSQLTEAMTNVESLASKIDDVKTKVEGLNLKGHVTDEIYKGHPRNWIPDEMVKKYNPEGTIEKLLKYSRIYITLNGAKFARLVEIDANLQGETMYYNPEYWGIFILNRDKIEDDVRTITALFWCFIDGDFGIKVESIFGRENHDGWGGPEITGELADAVKMRLEQFGKNVGHITIPKDIWKDKCATKLFEIPFVNDAGEIAYTAKFKVKMYNQNRSLRSADNSTLYTFEQNIKFSGKTIKEVKFKFAECDEEIAIINEELKKFK